METHETTICDTKTVPAGEVDSDACGARRAGRPRSEACRVAVYSAAYDVLTRNGLSGFTIERVAAEAGVGRSTIYRWWASRGALAVECLLDAVQKQYRAPATGDVTRDLSIHMENVVALMRSAPGRIIAGILAEGQSDPTTLAAFEEGYLRPRRRELEKIIAGGIERGQIRADLDVEMTIDLLIGALLYRLMSANGLDEDGLPQRLVESVVRGCRL